MADRTKRKIRRNHGQLVSELQMSPLLDYLYQDEVLTADNVERIKAEATTQDKARLLLQIMACNSEESNLLFVKTLQMPKNQPHLAEKILDTEDPDSNEDVEKQETAEPPAHKALHDWSVEEVCRWLKAHGLDQEVIECFRKEKISGDILDIIKIEDFREFHPGVVLGDRIKILRLRDTELTKEMENPDKTTLNSSSDSDNSSCSEELFVSATFRNFGLKTDSVTQNTYFQSESSAVDNLIEPVHRYVEAQNLDSLGAQNKFSVEVIPFICACLNDRTNGTFHLGVSKDGKIHGILANMDEFQHLLNELIEAGFSLDQLDTVKNCVRPVRLVRVVQNAHSDKKREDENLHVVEVDVVSSYSLCTNQAFFAKAPKPYSKQGQREYETTKLIRFQNGLQPTPISDKTLEQFMENKAKLATRRQEAEQELLNPKLKLQTSDLGKKLVRLMCPGGKSLDEDDIYPIFVMTSAPDLQSDTEDFISNTKFVTSVERKAVFDFDDASSPKSVFRNHADRARAPLQRLVVPVTDTTNRQTQNEKFITSLQDCLSSGSAHQPWIFCNGYEATQAKAMDVLEWKQTRRKDFLKAVDLLDKTIPPGRSIVVFLLFSENYEVLLSVAEEFCLKFSGNWVVISETSEEISRFKDYLINTAHIVADEKKFNRHSVVGMPWLHVNQTISGIACDFTSGETIIPTSSGTSIEISRAELNELPDIEVIGANHLSNVHVDEEELSKLDLEKEQSFYHGNEVEWWNFRFKTHVLQRDQLTEILCSTRSVLSGTYVEELDGHVGVVVIDHQPGSGATTLAKNILWELKTEYRCTVLRSFTNDTANQLCQLLKYGESADPKAVLILLDNFENVHELKESLELSARKLARGNKDFPSVAFVLLIVSRCSSAEQTVFPEENSCPRYFLGHNLSPMELQLFSKKFDEMEKDSQRRKRLDPRFLLSFNILRNNFSEDYVKRTVPRLVELVTDPRERKLLEYVAFVGVYDPGSNSIPASCFDWLMGQRTATVTNSSHDSAWLSKTSKYLKILINEDSKIPMRMKALRIIHSSLAQEINSVLAGNRPVSEVCLEFLQSDIFRTCLSIFKDELFRIVVNITVKREKRADGKYKAEFSPVVQKICESPEDDKTKIVEILKLAFQMTDNVYIAQHLARFLMSLKEWQEAEHWAKMATDMDQYKEVLWNTYAHVFSNQFHQRFPDGPVNAETVEASLELAFKAMDLFQYEQYVSDRETGNNPTGLLYEGGTIVELIKIFERIADLDQRSIRAFLLDKSFVPQCFQGWNESLIQDVKTLQNRAVRIMTELEEDKYHPEKDRAFTKVMPYEVKRLNERMIKIIEAFRNYFGEESNEVPTNFLPEEAASYRRRRIFRLKGNTFSGIFEHHKARNVHQLKNIKSLAAENEKTIYRNATDLQSFIGASIALFFLSEDVRSEENICQFKHLANLSRELIEMSNQSENNYAPLETYIFFALLNWPTSSSDYQEHDFNQIVDVLVKWKEAYQVKNPVPQGKSPNRKSFIKILFFLGKGTGMNRIVHHNKKSINNVEIFEGTLINEGQEIKTAIDTKNHECFVEIKTVEVENNRSRWNKNVRFALGFTWAGPVAEIIPIDDLRRTSRQSEGWNRTNAVGGAEYPESSPRFYTEGTSCEYASAMNSYLRQHPHSGNLYRTPVRTWQPHQYQSLQYVPEAIRQLHPRNTMPQTGRAAFNFYQTQQPPPRSTNYIRQQQAAEFYGSSSISQQTTGCYGMGYANPYGSSYPPPRN